MQIKYTQWRVSSSVVVPGRTGYWLVRGRKDMLWTLPSGKLEDSAEGFIKAAAREAKQELGVKVNVEFGIGIYTFMTNRGNYAVTAAFGGKIANKAGPKIRKPDEISEIKKFELGEIEYLERESKLRAGKLILNILNDYRNGKSIPLERIITID